MERYGRGWLVLVGTVAGFAFAGEPQAGDMARPAEAAATQPAEAENPFLAPDVPVSAQASVALPDVVRFALVDDFLVVQTTLSPRPMQFQKVDGAAQMMQVQIMHRGDRTPVYSPDTMQLVYVNSVGRPAVRTSLFAAPNHLNVSRDIVDGTTEKTVQFIQQSLPAMADSAVTVYVQTVSSPNAEDKITASAESFSAFVRKHPAETAQYVRPLLETFGRQPHLFAVDDSLGFSVFPEAYKGDAQERARIMDLVKQLGADDFQTRQSAGAKLSEMGVGAASILASLDRSKLSPEQVTRIDALVSRMRPSFDVKPSSLRHDPGFLLDCLLSANPVLRHAAWAQLQKETTVPVTFSDPADAKARVNEVYALRERLLGDPTTRPAAR